MSPAASWAANGRKRQPISDWDLEWDTLAADLAGSLDPDRLSALRQLDSAAWQRGDRILFVPTFYAIGWVPE